MVEKNQPEAVGDGQEVSETMGATPEPVNSNAPEYVESPPPLEFGASDTAATDVADTATESETAAVSLASLEEAEKRTPNESHLDTLFAQVAALFKGRGWLAGVLVGVLLLLFLLLPPISLGARLVNGAGYTALDADSPSLSHPDGLYVTVDPEAVEKLRVKLDSVPRADFMGDEIPQELDAARAALPAHLVPKSPYYRVDVKDEGPATMTVVVPNDSEPWETLDLYTWDGTAWTWLPSQLDRDAEQLVAEVEQLPASVVVMQTAPVEAAVVIQDDDLPPADVSGMLTYVDLLGMKIGTLGEMTGDPTLLPPGSVSTKPLLAPSVRNWVPGRAVNRALVTDMLNIEADRATHIQNLVALVQNGSYGGLVLDYAGLLAEDKAAYATFVRELAEALHNEGAWLAVTIDTPQLANGSWDTGGYDLRALGSAADQLRVRMPLNPQAYAPGGVTEQLLTWATGQVSRYKLYPIFSTLSTDGTATLTMDEVMTAIGRVNAVDVSSDGLVQVAPGTAFNFELTGGLAVETDALTGATRLKVGDTVTWLGTPEWLRTRLALLSRYNLGGVVLADLLNGGNFPGMQAAVQEHLVGTPAAPYTAPEITWQVTAPNGETVMTKVSLSQPHFSWVTPDVTGTYKVTANVAGIDKGAYEIAVVAPAVTGLGGGGEETTTDEGEATDEEAADLGTATEEDAEVSDEEGTLAAAFVADVTVPDNTQFEKGEQFEKTWRLKNSGSKGWPENTILTFVQGTQMTEATSVEVGAVEPGQEVDISVSLTAPNEDGTFRGDWSLSADGVQIPGGSMFVQILAGQPQVAETPDPAPATPTNITPVVGGAFELGGHIKDSSYPYADLMHYAGMNWAKVQVRYPNDASGLIAAAHARGFKIQLSALGANSMVTQGGFNETIASWVAQMAAAGADAIEIWNEPNLPREWQEGQINPQAYTQLLCASYSAIKAANPNVAVISAAPAPTGYFGGCYAHGCDDIPWLQGMVNAGAANCMDYIGAHHNSGATPPSATSGHPADPGSTHHSWFFLPQTQAYYNTFGGTRKLFYTELGYVSPEGYGWIPDTFAWGANTTVAQQAQWLSEVVQLSSQTGMVQAVIVWNVDFDCYGPCGGMQDPQAGYAIIRPDGSCPACESLHALLGTR